jgi:ubiquinone/menaquinone biosynthesis C-methylase UbiE
MLLGICLAWEEYYSTLSRLPRRLKKPVPFVEEALPTLKRSKVKSVLDLGCGTARHCVYLAKKGFDVVGVDVSRSALRIANEWVRKEQLTNAAFIQGTMTNIPFSDFHFDAVVSVSVMHHALKEDIVKSLNEVYRVLKKNGLFLANLASVNDPRYGAGEKVEDGTFRILEAFEERRFEELHHFFTEEEASEAVTCFAKAIVEPLKGKPNYLKITAVK